MTRHTDADWDGIKTLVNERLEFVDLITQLNAHFINPSLIRHTPEGGWTHPWIYFDSLRNYLLLTCFDLLGQPSAYKDFQTWLVAKSAETERTAALAKLSESTAPLEIASIVHREYLAIHGTRNAFFRFIDEVLPVPARAALLYSVRIRRIDPNLNKEIEVVESEGDKIRWLYNIRNSYTHKAVNTGSPAGGVFDNFGAPIVIDGIAKQGWTPIQWDHVHTFRIEYSVRNWPNVLRETVVAGLEAAASSPART
jgi:hypothetical protein